MYVPAEMESIQMVILRLMVEQYMLMAHQIMEIQQ